MRKAAESRRVFNLRAGVRLTVTERQEGSWGAVLELDRAEIFNARVWFGVGATPKESVQSLRRSLAEETTKKLMGKRPFGSSQTRLSEALAGLAKEMGDVLHEQLK